MNTKTGFNGMQSAAGISNLSEHVLLSAADEEDKEVTFHLDPFLHIKIERLEAALKFLGLNPTAEQQTEMYHRLKIDSDGTVAYGDFVALAEEMFKISSQKYKFNLPLLKPKDIKSLPNSRCHSEALIPLEVELKQANHERDKFKFENKRLQTLVHQGNLDLKSAENELLRVREELQSAVDESRSLRSRLRLVEEAQKAARKTEEDYEEVLRLLEVQLLQAPQNNTKQKETERKIMGLEHCLKKMEVEKRMYEAATEKLLRFASSVGEHLNCLLAKLAAEANTVDSSVGAEGDRLTHRHPHSNFLEFIATEARNTTEAVKSLLAIETVANGFENSNSSVQRQNIPRKSPSQKMTSSQMSRGLLPQVSTTLDELKLSNS